MTMDCEFEGRQL